MSEDRRGAARKGRGHGWVRLQAVQRHKGTKTQTHNATPGASRLGTGALWLQGSEAPANLTRGLGLLELALTWDGPPFSENTLVWGSV